MFATDADEVAAFPTFAADELMSHFSKIALAHFSFEDSKAKLRSFYLQATMGIVVGNSTHSQSSLGTTEGRRSTGKALIKVGVDLIENGQLGEALEVFQRAQTALSIDAGITKKDDPVNDGTSMTTCNTTDCKQHGTTDSVSSFSTSDQDNNAVSSSSNHVPKPPPPPSSSCCKRLRQARSLARQGSVNAEKKRKTELANDTNAKIHGGNGSSPSRRTNCAAAKKGRGTKSVEEMAHVEMYREDISEDSVSVRASTT